MRSVLTALLFSVLLKAISVSAQAAPVGLVNVTVQFTEASTVNGGSVTYTSIIPATGTCSQCQNVNVKVPAPSAELYTLYNNPTHLPNITALYVYNTTNCNGTPQIYKSPTGDLLVPETIQSLKTCRAS